MRPISALFLVLVAGGFASAMMHAHYRIYVFPAGFVLPWFGTLLYLVASYRPRELLSWLALGFEVRAAMDPSEAIRARRLCRDARSITFTMGLLAVVMELTTIMTRLDDPKSLLPALALVLCSVLYALLLGGVLFRSMEAQIRRAEETPSAPAVPRDE